MTPFIVIVLLIVAAVVFVKFAKQNPNEISVLDKDIDTEAEKAKTEAEKIAADVETDIKDKKI